MTSSLPKSGIFLVAEQAAKFASDMAKSSKAVGDFGDSSTKAAGKVSKAQQEQQNVAKQLAATLAQVDKQIEAAELHRAQVTKTASDQITAALNEQAAAQQRLQALNKLLNLPAQIRIPKGQPGAGQFLSLEDSAALKRSMAAQQLGISDKAGEQRIRDDAADAAAKVTLLKNSLVEAEAAASRLQQKRGFLVDTLAQNPAKTTEQLGITAAQVGLQKQYTTAVEEMDNVVQKAGKSHSQLAQNILNAAKAAAVAFVTYKALDIIKNVITTTADLGAQTFKLQQIIGGTAQEASGLIFAFKQFGIEPAQVATTLGIFSRNLALVEENAAGLNTRGQQSTRVLAGLGIQVLDTNGKLLPTINILKSLADKFAATTDENLKAGIASQLFGEQGGRTLLPFLNQGSKGIEQLQARAKELGVTFTDEGAKSAFEFGQAQKELNQALQGLAITIGQDLLPVVKDFTVSLTKFVSDNREKIGSFAKTAVGDLKAFAEGVGVAFNALKTGLSFLPENQAEIVAAIAAIGLALKLAFGIGSPWLVGLALGLTLIGKLKEGTSFLGIEFGGTQSPTGERGIGGRPTVQGEVANRLRGQDQNVLGVNFGAANRALTSLTPGFLQSDEFKQAGKVIDELAKKGITTFEQFSKLDDDTLLQVGAISQAEYDSRQKAKKAAEDAGKASNDASLTLDGFTDAEKRAIAETQKLAQTFKASSEAAGQVDPFIAKLKQFGVISKDLADNIGLTATQAGNVQGYDALQNAEKRTAEEAFNLQAALATVAFAFQKTASVGQKIVLELARSSLTASQQAVSAITSKPTREVLNLNVNLASARLASAQATEANQPTILALQKAIKENFKTTEIDKQLKELSRKADATDIFFRDLKRAAEKQQKALDAQANTIDQQLNQMKLGDQLAQIAYDKINANLEKQISATQTTASDLQKAFLQSNENLQRQINARIGVGDRAGALDLVNQQRTAADLYHKQAKGLQDSEQALKAQQKAAKDAEDARKAQEKFAELGLQVQKDAIEQEKKRLTAVSDVTDAENAAKDALDKQKQALEDQKQAIEDNKQKLQDQLQVIQDSMDKYKEDQQTIQNHIDVLGAQTDLEKARADAADHTALSQEEQKTALENLTTQIGISSQAVVDLAKATNEQVVPEMKNAALEFSTLQQALHVLADYDYRGKFIDNGIDPAAEQAHLFSLAEESATEAVRRMTQAMVTGADNIDKKVGPSSNFMRLFGTPENNSPLAGALSGLTGSRGPVANILTHHNAAGGIYSQFAFTTLAENGPEAVLPLTRPARAREILAQLPAGMLASLLPRDRQGPVFAPNINITGETLDTMEALAHRAVAQSFRDARSQSTRAQSLLTSGIGAA